MDGIVKRVAVVVLLLALLGVAACGGEDERPVPPISEPDQDGARARALRDIARLAHRIEGALTPAPCGTDPLRAMGRAGNDLDRLIYDHLYRSDWPHNGDADGPFPKDASVRRAAVDAVCRFLPLLRALIDCEEEEVRQNAIAHLTTIRQGGPRAGANWPPEWDEVLRTYESEFDHYVRLGSDPDRFVAECALELVVVIAPESGEARRLAERSLSGRTSIDPSFAALVLGGSFHVKEGQFTPLLVDAALPPRSMADEMCMIDPFLVRPSPELALRMREALRSGDWDQRNVVLRAVATPLCLDFLDDVLALENQQSGANLTADAANAIVGMGGEAKAALPAMVRALARDDRQLRVIALKALTLFQVASAENVEAILAALQRGAPDDEFYLRRCIDALGACGAGVPAATTTLRKLAEHRNVEVADRARATLARLHGESQPR